MLIWGVWRRWILLLLLIVWLLMMLRLGRRRAGQWDISSRLSLRTRHMMMHRLYRWGHRHGGNDLMVRTIRLSGDSEQFLESIGEWASVVGIIRSMVVARVGSYCCCYCRLRVMVSVPAVKWLLWRIRVMRMGIVLLRLRVVPMVLLRLLRLRVITMLMMLVLRNRWNWVLSIEMKIRSSRVPNLWSRVRRQRGM